jgi:hypothetical protein
MLVDIYETTGRKSLVHPLCPQNNQTKTPRFPEEFLDFLNSYSWCSIKDAIELYSVLKRLIL